MDSYSLTRVGYAKKASSQLGPQHLNVKVISAMSFCLVPDPMSTVIFHPPGPRILELKKEILFVQRVPWQALPERAAPQRRKPRCWKGRPPVHPATYQLPKPSQSNQREAAQLSAGPTGARSSWRSHTEHVVPGKGCARQVGLFGEHSWEQGDVRGTIVTDSGMCSPQTAAHCSDWKYRG